jgi:hypothetical protein
MELGHGHGQHRHGHWAWAFLAFGILGVQSSRHYQRSPGQGYKEGGLDIALSQSDVKLGGDNIFTLGVTSNASHNKPQ